VGKFASSWGWSKPVKTPNTTSISIVAIE
jgi:hypothetical protein